jgi:hypothetical protein
MTTVPAHSFSAPVRAFEIAAALVIPSVCGVLVSNSSACTTRTPFMRQSVVLIVPSPESPDEAVVRLEVSQECSAGEM